MTQSCEAGRNMSTLKLKSRIILPELQYLQGIKVHSHYCVFGMHLRQALAFPHRDRKFPISLLMQSTAENADCCIQCKSALIKLLYNCNLQLQSHTQSQTLVSGTCLVRNDYRVVNYKLSIRSPGYKLRINNSTNNLSNMTRQKWAVVVVTSDSRGLRFKSSRRQTVLKRRK